MVWSFVLKGAIIRVARQAQSRHSARTVRTKPSAIAFAFGARISFGRTAKPHRVTSQEAVRSAQAAFEEWRREVKGRGRSTSKQPFDNLPPSELRHRLATLAQAGDFAIMRVEFLRPRQLAPVLFLSPRTVDMHVRNILTKLGCRSRTDATRKAGELGLLA